MCGCNRQLQVQSLMRNECSSVQDCWILYFICQPVYLFVRVTFDSPYLLMRNDYTVPAFKLNIILLTSPFSL